MAAWLEWERLWVTGAGMGTNPGTKNHERKNQLSLQLFYSTPMEYGPRVGRIYPFGGLKLSSVYRVFSGTPFEYQPPEGPAEWRTQSPSMRTDLHVQKDFQKLGGIRPAIFMEVTNLFDERNTASTSLSYVRYGLKEPAL